ncbi:protein CUTL 8, a [Trichuris trichiura]|uniref:Protein CUTL 8, a n=1 Tax=Trichuris trichiura TaxID=36087 RepID=A0A077Z1A6_TRITR|nr:protein CUTL 8, a [Trichuris trichiura]
MGISFQNAIFLVSVILLLHVYSATCSGIDNDVLNCNIQCSEDTITVNFVTRNPFQGRLFVKGMSDKTECSQSFSNPAASTTKPSMSFGFGVCNMHRSRMVMLDLTWISPLVLIDPQPGMMQSLVVVISFHRYVVQLLSRRSCLLKNYSFRLFITRVDRAYMIQCFYMESEKTVASDLEVSTLTTGQLLDTAQMPTCAYEVRRGGPDGAVIRFAEIGEAVHHVWFCDTTTHKILVKNCFVDDGQGNQVKIIDENGCAIEPMIIGNLNYASSDTTKAWVDSYVFKFADKPHVFFHCTLQLCNKGDDFCENLTVRIQLAAVRFVRILFLHMTFQPPHCAANDAVQVQTAAASSTDGSESNPYGFILRQQKQMRKHRRHTLPFERNKQTAGQTHNEEIDLFTPQMTIFDLESHSLRNDRSDGPDGGDLTLQGE